MSSEISPQKDLEVEISEYLERLQALLAKCSTESALGWCFGYQLSTGNDLDNEDRLASPAKQIPFLLSVLLSTPSPKEDYQMTRAEWRESKELLERLFHAYMVLYFPSKEQLGKLSNEWIRSREVSMLAFLHFFNTGLLASVEQINDRIRRYVVPFDDQLKKDLGISASEAVSICKWIYEHLQRNLDRFQAAFIEQETARHALLDRAKAEKWSTERIKEAARDPLYFDKAAKIFDGLNGLGKISISELNKAFPNTADSFLKAFSIKRGEGAPLRYPTEETVFSSKPLVKLSNDTIMCITANSMIEAVLTVGERTLFKGAARDKYLRARDQELEREACELLKAFLDPDARIHATVFETPDAQFEHDVIAEDSNVQIVLEAKASPPSEPFRDPDKAFPRIRDAFRGDKGIQKAFLQANRIVRRLRNNENVDLFDAKGNKIAELKPDPKRLPACICVTRDNFGGLATRLSLLLEKDDDDAYPWAPNILDLANLAMAWRHLKLGSRDFRTYLEQRALLHRKGFADDELDFAGYFIRHGDFRDALRSKADLFQFNPEYSSLFDDIYRHVHLDGPVVEIKRTKPVMMDLRKSLARDEPVFVDLNENHNKRLRLRLKKQREKAKAKIRKQSQIRNRRKKA